MTPAPARRPLPFRVHHNQTLELDALRSEAANAIEAQGLTQADVARDLGKHRSTINRALGDGDAKMIDVLRDIIGRYTDYEIDPEPTTLYRVTRKTAA